MTRALPYQRLLDLEYDMSADPDQRRSAPISEDETERIVIELIEARETMKLLRKRVSEAERRGAVKALKNIADRVGIDAFPDHTGEWWDGYRAGQRRSLQILNERIDVIESGELA